MRKIGVDEFDEYITLILQLIPTKEQNVPFPLPVPKIIVCVCVCVGGGGGSVIQCPFSLVPKPLGRHSVMFI